ncbi:MAG: 16S rRNA (cytosine(1402)-N(4))-methyltransferase RsmH [Limnochordia bacterium]
MEFSHVPVLPRETIDILAPRPGGIYVDGTVGGGGHARLILERIGPQGQLIGIDRDPAALAKAGQTLREFPNVTLVHSTFFDLPSVLGDLSIEQVDGFLFDLGVSSHQLDIPQRGFSYMHNAPLDMRMDPRTPRTAAKIVNEASEEELKRIIRSYGEERWAGRIARFIVEARQREPITTTYQLVDIIKAAIPARARREGGHPAKRTFQALRIAVNNELDGLQETLQVLIDFLRPGGRLAVISFHSLEDRIVKQQFQAWARRCTCPPELPICVCKREPLVEILTSKPITASEDELAANPRARSAKLRAVQKI